jgi:signal transduction histidine kinase
MDHPQHHRPGANEPFAQTQPRAKTLLGHAKATLARDAVSSPREVEPGTLFEQIRARLRAPAAAKGVALRFGGTCRRVRVQPTAFSEALYQLTHNAVEAARRGHAVDVHVRNTAEGDVMWQIRDRGDGMSLHELRELGLPRLNSGLGVMFAWAVVEHHGGLLHFESAPGGGTTATIWLPG